MTAELKEFNDVITIITHVKLYIAFHGSITKDALKQLIHTRKANSETGLGKLVCDRINTSKNPIKEFESLCKIWEL